MYTKDIDALRELCRKGCIKWTLHALKRIRERELSSSDVIDTVLSGYVVLHYHDDKPFPSWLLYNGDADLPLHVVVSTDGKNAYFITAYIPNLNDWQSDFKTRKD